MHIRPNASKRYTYPPLFIFSCALEVHYINVLLSGSMLTVCCIPNEVGDDDICSEVASPGRGRRYRSRADGDGHGQMKGIVLTGSEWYIQYFLVWLYIRD